MCRAALAAVVTIALGLVARAEDWPTLGRDRTHNAVSPEKGAPTDWQVAIAATKDTPAKAARNVKWSVLLGSRSLGGPVVANGTLYVMTESTLHAIQAAK